MYRPAALALVLAVAAGLAAAAFAAESPTALRAAMLKAVDAKHSVHYVSKDSSLGASSLLVSDVASDRGIQRLTFTAGGKSGIGTVLAFRRAAYIRGDAFTLQNYFTFKRAQAKKYAGKWIYIPRTDKAYAPVAADATFESFASDLLPKRNLAIVKATRNGKKVVGLRGDEKQGTVDFVEWVYAPASGTPLPLQEKATAVGAPGSDDSLTTMSRWNEPVSLKAPAHAVPIAIVRGGGGGGPAA